MGTQFGAYLLLYNFTIFRLAIVYFKIPRVGAMLDSSPISDVMEISSEDTFLRPTYAGNAIARVRSKATVKFLTVRGASFEPSPASGGSASVEPFTSYGMIISKKYTLVSMK